MLVETEPLVPVVSALSLVLLDSPEVVSPSEPEVDSAAPVEPSPVELPPPESESVVQATNSASPTSVA